MVMSVNDMVWYPVCVKVIMVLKRTMVNAMDSLDYFSKCCIVCCVNVYLNDC